MKLLAYTIAGQIIGIDITSWTNTLLSGNTAFMAIADTGSTPTNYVDITSFDNWDKFGGKTTLTQAQIKTELIKLIPTIPTPEQIITLQNWGIFTDTTFLSGQTGTYSGDLRVEGKLWVETIRRVKQEANIAYVRVDQESGVSGGNNIAGLAILNPTGATTGYTSLDAIPAYYLGVNNNGVLVAGWSGNTQPVMLGSAGGLTTYNATNTGAITTTSLTDVLMTGMQITNVPAGQYFLSFGTSLSHTSNNGHVITTIYVGGVAVPNSLMTWERGAAQGNIIGTHTYANYPITVASTATVDIRWQTDAATATSTNRYMSLIKVG